jgi:hypothetical protein
MNEFRMKYIKSIRSPGLRSTLPYVYKPDVQLFLPETCTGCTGCSTCPPGYTGATGCTGCNEGCSPGCYLVDCLNCKECSSLNNNFISGYTGCSPLCGQYIPGFSSCVQRDLCATCVPCGPGYTGFTGCVGCTSQPSCRPLVTPCSCTSCPQGYTGSTGCASGCKGCTPIQNELYQTLAISMSVIGGSVFLLMLILLIIFRNKIVSNKFLLVLTFTLTILSAVALCIGLFFVLLIFLK